MKITLMDGTVTRNKRTPRQLRRLTLGMTCIAVGIAELVRVSELNGCEQLGDVFSENDYTVNAPNK